MCAFEKFTVSSGESKAPTPEANAPMHRSSRSINLLPKIMATSDEEHAVSIDRHSPEILRK